MRTSQVENSSTSNVWVIKDTYSRSLEDPTIATLTVEMPEVPLPYEPKSEPIKEEVPYNGVTFFTTTWKVPENVTYKGKIIYVHGFCEHSNIYTQFFDDLSQNGYEVFFFDQRGAGDTSPGKEAGKTDEFHTFDDLDFMIKRNLDAREDKDEKFILGGHSMGGGISLNYAIHGKYKDNFKGLFVSGPLVTLHAKTTPNIILRTLQPVINRLLPTFKIDSNLRYDFITSNEGWKKFIMDHDKRLVGTVRQFNDMFERGLRLLQKDHVAKFSPDIKLLVLHGDKDYINDPNGSKKFFALLPDTVDKKFVEVKDGLHSLFIERKELYDDVFDNVLTFLNSTV